MPRKIPELEQADIDLQGWAEWCLRNLERSRIGYKSKTAEQRFREGLTGVQLSGVFASREPNVMMPRWVAQVDRALKDAPKPLKDVVLVRHFLLPGDLVKLGVRKPGVLPRRVTDDDRARVLGVAKTEYRGRVDVLLGWVAAGVKRLVAFS